MKILLKNVKILGEGAPVDILTDGAKIAQIAPNITANADKTLDCMGKAAFPAFCDMHVHLREPGYTSKEELSTGLAAAARGGFSDVACMPNTNPPIDKPYLVEFLTLKSREIGLTRLHPIACVTKDQAGAELAEMALLRRSGAVAFSDDGSPVDNANVMRLALEYASGVGALIVAHCEDKQLSAGGHAHEGAAATRLGIAGISRTSEDAAVARDIILAETLNAHLHICHVSTEGSVRLVREAKKRGVSVTCETAPHYFTLTDEAIDGYNTAAKVNPPLREKSDVAAIIKGITDGTIDCIACDHAPHTQTEKSREFALAPFGISGIETSFAVSYTHLVKSGKISLPRLVELMSACPRQILALPAVSLTIGSAADITVADLDKKYTIDPVSFLSKGKNTPFAGMEIYGEIQTTIASGKVIYEKKN